jgi:hypothetical protein
MSIDKDTIPPGTVYVYEPTVAKVVVCAKALNFNPDRITNRRANFKT